MSGCVVCVHDLYQESLEGYDTSVKALRASPAALGIAESGQRKSKGIGAEEGRRAQRLRENGAPTHCEAGEEEDVGGDGCRYQCPMIIFSLAAALVNSSSDTT